MREVAVVGKIYAGKDRDGDFKWMVKQKQYSDALFLIAENFLDSLLEDAGAGGGTAVLRPKCPQRVAKGDTPRAVGVPTGWSLTASGFPQMDNYVKTVIDVSLDRIALVLDQHPQFKRLIYSCDAKAPNLLGVKIFEDTLNPSVREYISEQIHDIANREPSPQTNTLKKILKVEHKLLRVCLLITLNEEKARKEKRAPAARSGSRLMQPSLQTGSKRPFGSL